MTATCKYRGRPSRNGSWTDSQGLKPSAARKVLKPTECRAHDAVAVAAGASHHVHGTTKDAEGADHPHLHRTAAVAGATGLSPITVAPAGACDHERTTAGAADAADPACTSRTAFFSKSCLPLASVWCSGARSGGDTESQESHEETQAGAAYTRRAVSGAPSNGPTVRPSVSTQSAKWECSREPTASAQSTHCKCSAWPAVTPSPLRFWICRARRVRPSRWSRPSARHRFAHRCVRRQIHAER